MSGLELPILFFLLRFSLIFFAGQTGSMDMIQTDYSNREKKCNVKLIQVHNKVFPLASGSKQIVTYSVSKFKDNEACWRQMEQTAKKISNSSEIAGVYFFTLPATEIIEINDLTNDFSQYGINLIGVYWKDPDSGTKLKRFPNNVVDGE